MKKVKKKEVAKVPQTVSTPTVSALSVERRAVESIVPYEKNPRLNDAAVSAVARSIREFGFRQPIVVDARGVIVVGHTRWKAAKQLGLSAVPVVVANELTPGQVKAYRLADNKTHELSLWNLDLLAAELDEIAGDAEFNVDMAEFGFEEPGTEKEDAAPKTEVAIPELYQVVVECEDETDQNRCYEELVSAGRKCHCVCL